MCEPHIILGVHISDRMRNASEVQEVFTEFDCHIRTRVGLHDVSEGVCGPSGVVLIEFFGSIEGSEAMKQRLGAVEGVHVQSMVFGH